VNELIIAVGVNEDVTREQDPHVPITPSEILERQMPDVEAL